jgi:hypothetical protein
MPAETPPHLYCQDASGLPASCIAGYHGEPEESDDEESEEESEEEGEEEEEDAAMGDDA